MLSKSGGNSKFFHPFANHKKNVNTIWKIARVDGQEVKIFDDIAKQSVEHFENIFKEEGTASIAKEVKMTSIFPSFVTEDVNQSLMEEASKDKLHTVLHSFQKDKSPRLVGWPIEFFLDFYDLIEEDLLRVIEESRSFGKVLAALMLLSLQSLRKLIILSCLRNSDLSLCAIASTKL